MARQNAHHGRAAPCRSSQPSAGTFIRRYNHATGVRAGAPSICTDQSHTSPMCSSGSPKFKKIDPTLRSARQHGSPKIG
jgi:hypothetical protein